MMLMQQVFDRALLLAGELDKTKEDILYVLCGTWSASLAARLRDGITVEACREDFLTAASLFALADLNSLGMDADVEEFRAGDLTVKKSANADGTGVCLQRRAELLMRPYVKDSFSFLGV